MCTKIMQEAAGNIKHQNPAFQLYDINVIGCYFMSPSYFTTLPKFFFYILKESAYHFLKNNWLGGILCLFESHGYLVLGLLIKEGGNYSTISWRNRGGTKNLDLWGN
jgi:hypothetical protein